MSTDVALLRSHHPRGCPPPVLIAVPSISTPSARRPKSALGPQRRRRRRLKREVRIGGLAILVVGPLMGALLMGRDQWFLTPGMSAPPPAPVVRLSPDLEPAGLLPAAEIAAPLVRPAGYLLPAGFDDRPEDAAHAGT